VVEEKKRKAKAIGLSRLGDATTE